MLKIGFSGVNNPSKDMLSSVAPGLVEPGFERQLARCAMQCEFSSEFSLSLPVEACHRLTCQPSRRYRPAVVVRGCIVRTRTHTRTHIHTHTHTHAYLPGHQPVGVGRYRPGRRCAAILDSLIITNAGDLARSTYGAVSRLNTYLPREIAAADTYLNGMPSAGPPL